MTDAEIEALLAEAVDAYRKLPRNIKVGAAIEAVTGRTVVPLSGDQQDQTLLNRICRAAEELIRMSKEAPIKTTRLNELGNAIEQPLLEACRAVGLAASWPTRSDGSGSRTGYPDIAVDLNGECPAYLEAKVIGAGSESSSFRSFYLSPSDNPKVCYDARHLLVAFVHRREPNGADGLERYALVSYKVVDLARVLGQVKFEYQSSNKNMYLGGAVVASGS